MMKLAKWLERIPTRRESHTTNDITNARQCVCVAAWTRQYGGISKVVYSTLNSMWLSLALTTSSAFVVVALVRGPELKSVRIYSFGMEGLTKLLYYRGGIISLPLMVKFLFMNPNSGMGSFTGGMGRGGRGGGKIFKMEQEEEGKC